MKELELYIHIPFCKRKCAYCDFLSFASTEVEQKAYVDALLMEIEQYQEIAKEYCVSTIFIGGGTPSILEGWYMACIMNKIRAVFTICEDAEITIEVNPGTMDDVKMQIYKAIGINRISIGLQATNDEELKMLGRIHCYEEFLETYQMIRNYGIHNINVDLISAIPKQTVASWTETLEQIVALDPTHISAYSLIIEEGTLFHEKLSDYEDLLPSEDEEREMYHLTRQRLQEAGYIRYETSNYAKEGYECRHNLGYWERVNYLGIGLGAASLIENVRYTNESNMDLYIEKCSEDYRENNQQESNVSFGKCDCDEQVKEVGEISTVHAQNEVLSREAQMEEFMFLGLRKIKGISKVEFQQLFQAPIEDIYGNVIDSLRKKQLLETVNDKIKLTELGMDVSNYVMSEFLL